ncbi:MAG: sigma-70 family RNA polymerase sigma factor [Acidimicrobiia bacterium]|nr:sigma-70 family RNA polymerase sigma factor [Acidimicrobiia bacterium]
MSVQDTQIDSFTEFVEVAEPRLRRALVARYGYQEGREAVAEALAYAWEHWERVSAMANPVGYLYRVGRTRGTWGFRRVARLPRPESSNDPPWFEPALPAALENLPARQRTAVMLVKAHGYTYDEAAGVMGVSRTSVQKHVERALVKLRQALEVRTDA